MYPKMDKRMDIMKKILLIALFLFGLSCYDSTDTLPTPDAYVRFQNSTSDIILGSLKLGQAESTGQIQIGSVSIYYATDPGTYSLQEWSNGGWITLKYTCTVVGGNHYTLVIDGSKSLLYIDLIKDY
jgi:hypothetical protein